MNYITGQSRGQITLLPDCVDDLISTDNPVRVIDAFIDALDIEECGFKRCEPNITGRPSYDPRDLLKLYVYGYFNKIRSSRKLMSECTRNLELFFLLNRLTPDFRTISDFRKDNSKAIKNVFGAFVKLCLKLDLYQKELISIDGSKFRAVNSKSNSFNKDILNKKLKRIDENIARYLSNMDTEDSSDIDSQKYTNEQIKAAINELKLRKQKYTNFLKELEVTGETQILTTDPEARVMQSKNGFHCYYNVQTAVDGGSHLIAGYEVTNRCNDEGLLKLVADNAKEMLETPTIEVVADKGYDSRHDIENCVMNGIIPNVALKYDQKERLYNYKYTPAEITEDIKSSPLPENIQKCISSGFLPTCYENSNIQVELQSQTAISCFLLNDDGTVTCPMGSIMSKTKMRGNNTIYANRTACRQCPNRCTGGRTYKTVSFGPNTKYVPAKMFGSSFYRLNEIPIDIVQTTPYNSFDRRDEMNEKVILRIKEDIHKMKQRMCISEHPFGTVKWYHGAHYFLCKGKEKVSAEMGLSFLAYNLRRAINIIGVQAIIAAI
jgi:transposase